MKGFQNYQLAYFICISLKYSFSSALQMHTTSFGKNLNNFLDNFQTCHIKYFLENTKNNADVCDAALLTINYLQNSVSVSIDVLYDFDDVSTPKNHHHRGKFTSCFIHWYMVDQLGLYQEPRHILQKMKESEIAREIPDYFIFYEYHNRNDSVETRYFRQIFYTKILPPLSLMGPIVRIDFLQNIYLVCMPCQGEDIFIQLSERNGKIETGWKTVYTDLQGAHINTMWAITKKQVQSVLICDGFANNKVNTQDKEMVAISSPLVCVHQILSKKLNYSIAIPDNLETIAHGAATNVLLISEELLEMYRNTNMERWRWVPYATRFNRFYFITVVKKPGFNAIMLIQPFTLSMWTLLIVSGIIMIFATKAINAYTSNIVDKYSHSNNKREVSTLKICISIIASVLDQATDYHGNLNNTTRFISIKLLSFTWFFWLVVALQVGMFYKGVMFSFVAKPTDPQWPETPGQLVDMPFHIITLSTQIIVDKGLQTRSSFLINSVLSATKNPNFPLTTTYNKLKERVRYYDSDFLNFALAVVSKKITNETYEKIPASNLVFIDQSGFIYLEFTLCAIFMPQNIVSQPKLFPGYLLVVPWAVWNTYFQPIFERFLGRLHESGIEHKMNAYLGAVEQYNVLNELSINLENLGDSRLYKPTRGQLQYRYFQETSFQKSAGEESAAPLSFEMLKSVFIIWLFIIFCATFSLLLEKLICI